MTKAFAREIFVYTSTFKYKKQIFLTALRLFEITAEIKRQASIPNEVRGSCSQQL